MLPLLVLFRPCRRTLFFWLLIIGNGLTSCATKRELRYVEPNFPVPGKLTENAFNSLKSRYGDGSKWNEWAFNYDPEKRDRPPQWGLALSGGGTRSASFSIGFLKALSDEGILPKIDIMSTVSGGSYAALWYYSQNLLRDKIEDCANSEHLSALDYHLRYSDKQLFAVDYQSKKLTDDALQFRFQTNLEESSNILITHQKSSIGRPLLNYLEIGGKVLLHIPTVAARVPISVAFDWDSNLVNFPAEYYRHGLERTYSFSPLDADQFAYFNDDPFLFFLERVRAQPIEFDDIQKLLYSRRDTNEHMPFLVVNTTGWRSKLLELYEDYSDVSDRIFEFTPLRAGSDQFGYHAHEEFNNIPFSDAVALSGAAVDLLQRDTDANGSPRARTGTQQFGAFLFSTLNLDLGEYIPNPNINPARGFFHKFYPFPLYLVDDFFFSGKDDKRSPEREDRFSPKIYLNDGGKSENLGAFSLIRRGVENIIIVDAAQDEESLFGDLRRLAYALKRELGVEFVPQRKEGREGESDFKYCSSGEPLKERPNVKHLKLEDSVLCAELVRRPDPGANDRKEFYTFASEGSKKTVDVIKLYYVKLSMDMDGLKPQIENSDHYTSWVRDYSDGDKDFPHNSTADIFYSVKQFRAYRDLGLRVGNKLIKLLPIKLNEKIKGRSNSGKYLPKTPSCAAIKKIKSDFQEMD